MYLVFDLAIAGTLYSPFIPKNMNTEFNVSFWASLVSNLLTGIIVGLIIWRIQSRAEKKQIQFQCEREMNVFLQHLRYSYEASNENFISSDPVKCIPENILESIELILK